MVDTLAERISDRFRRRILEGGYGPRDKIHSERQLSATFGVSRETIRAALDILAEDGLIERVPRRGTIITDQGRSLASRHSLAIVRWNDARLHTEIIRGILRMARRHDDQPVIIDARESHHRLLDAVTHPPEGTKGLILLPYEHPSYAEAVEKALKAGTRMVFVDRILGSFDVSSVTVDNFSGAYQSAEHLIRVHDRPVYFLGYTDGPSSNRDRYRGWAEAMRDNGFDDYDSYLLSYSHPEYDVVTAGAESNIREVLSRFFTRKDRDKCSVFAMNDGLARVLYDAAEEYGLRVGKDVFVAGFDGLPLCERLSPPLTTVVQPMEWMGYEAAKLFYEELSNERTRPIHKVLPVELKIRASSAGVT